MDPVRNPYAPGAGQRPPELAGRDTELSAFDVVLERIAHGRPERSLVLGSPAKVVRTLTDEEVERLRRGAAHYVERAAHYRAMLAPAGDRA